MNLPPKGRLLYVPAHTAAVIYRDMKRAGVDKVTPLGKLDFHALRTAYINPLAAQDMPAGLHHISWDGYDDGGRQVAAGVFFYRLEVSFETGVPAFTEVRKLTLAE